MREAALRLASLLPRARLDAAVMAWAGRAPPRGRWAVAFSGGADSLAVLLLLWAHWPERRSRLRALHFDHRLRGAESRADARFCRRVCAELEVEFVAGVWPGRHRDASEAEARAARLAFFARHARVVWQGHQQGDVAETMLMRLARGSGAGGLSAPRPVQSLPGGRTHLRPLLTLKKAEIVAALRQVGAEWREDSTNRGMDFLRNRVRQKVIPAWIKAAQRDALAGAARSRALLEEDDQALDAWLEALSPRTRKPGPLALGPLAGKPRALMRRALHRWLQAETRAGDISRVAFDSLLEDLIQGRAVRHSLGRKGFAVIDQSTLRFESIRRRR